jgi:hypothetical protein
MGDIDADECRLETASTGADAEIAASRMALVGLALAREEVVLAFPVGRR